MKILIVEDDFTSRLLLQEMLKEYGVVHIAVDGLEAVTAVRQAMREKDPYDFVCLDIMLPELDGHQVLKHIRDAEKERGIQSLRGTKIVMTTGLRDAKNVMKAFDNLCDDYLIKPIGKGKLLDILNKHKLIGCSTY